MTRPSTRFVSVRHGMTLMELMIGLVITTVMAATGVAAFGSIIDHRRIIKESTVDMERASALRDQLRTWIGFGTPVIQTGGVPNIGGRASSSTNSTISAAAATGDELTVTTSAANPAGTPTARMRFFIDEDEGTAERGLTIEFQASNQSPLQRRELERSIGGLTVEFLDQRTNRWHPASEAATIQPIALRVSLRPRNGGQLPAILLVPMIFKMGNQ